MGLDKNCKWECDAKNFLHYHPWGTEQYFRWIDGFTTLKKRIGINLIPVTDSQ